MNRSEKASKLAGVDLQPGGHAVSAVTEQTIRTGSQRLHQVKPLDAAAGAASVPALVEANDHARAVEPLRQPRGDDPDHPDMPALAGP